MLSERSQTKRSYTIWGHLSLTRESFKPPAVILIQSFSFIAVKPFWSPLAVAENTRELRYKHFYLPRHLRWYLKFQGLHIFHTAPSGRSFQSPILTLLSTQVSIPGARMEHMRVVFYCPLNLLAWACRVVRCWLTGRLTFGHLFVAQNTCSQEISWWWLDSEAHSQACGHRRL